MQGNMEMTGLLKLQRSLVVLIIILFASTIIAYFADKNIGLILSRISILVLILTVPIRLVWIAGYFRKTGNIRYQILSYLVIVIIALSALWKLIR
jgi:hypothetical protein